MYTACNTLAVTPDDECLIMITYLCSPGHISERYVPCLEMQIANYSNHPFKSCKSVLLCFYQVREPLESWESGVFSFFGTDSLGTKCNDDIQYIQSF